MGVDVRIEGGTILEVGAGLVRRTGEPEVNARGGAVIPGLHDHHVHLRAWAAARTSVDLSTVRSPDDLDRRLRTAATDAPAGTWLRGVGWHESTGGNLDRHRLDALTARHPVRIQHRTGALWVLNSAALTVTGAATAPVPGIERDASDEPTGRLWRADDWLRAHTVPTHDPFPDALTALAAEAAAQGVTRWTDATPGRAQSETDALATLWSAALPGLVLMSPSGTALPGFDTNVRLGPQKIVLDDATLPTAGELAATIRASHAAGSPVAVHCVTAEQLVTLVAALDEAGAALGDRVEHAGIVPPGYAARLAALGLALVTNPGFLADRGDRYRQEVEERDWLYPVRSLLDAGVTVAAATDAPFGPADPWVAIAAAVDRRTASGHVLAPDERVPPSTALALFHTDPDAPGRARRIAPGHPSDVVLLHTPLATALASPSAQHVRATF
ncbi:amidohydrolase family protein [Cryptosporangium sp. NPDC048952]|uniref:amidohydrolase family protein n=1 Tax=Cryptosporangium sp. NPDC048952 TaxID=3363961 RepID=UPI00371CD65E